MAVETEERKEEDQKEKETTGNKEVEANNMAGGSGAPGKVEEELLTGDVKVKITGGEAKVDMDSGFTGMTKEELMKYANDPFWVRLRWTLFILFWLIWVGMLVASIVIIVMAPKCPSPEPRKWYMKGPIYQVVVNSFKDSDGDGLGDLKGVEDELGYLVDSGVNTVWLSEFSTGQDINKEVGDVETFKSLVAEMKKRKLKLIVDLPEQDALLDAAFWLDLGVDGFNSRANVDTLKKVRALLDNTTDTEGGKVLMNDNTGGMSAQERNALYGDGIESNNVSPLVHLPINYDLDLVKALKPGAKADQLNNTLNTYFSSLPTNAWPNFALGSKDLSRAATRVGQDMVDAINMLLFLLPGTPFTYYGEEIGMADNSDAISPHRTPMQWRNDSQAGFSTHQGQLNINDNYKTINVESQVGGLGRRSHYTNYVALAKLRHQEAILFGRTDFFVKNNGTVFGLTRVKRGNPGYLLLINVGTSPTEVNLLEQGKVKNVPAKVRMMIKSVGKEGVEEIPKAETKSFDSDKTPLEAREAVVFTFVPNFEEE